MTVLSMTVCMTLLTKQTEKATRQKGTTLAARGQGQDLQAQNQQAQIGAQEDPDRLACPQRRQQNQVKRG